MNVILLNNSVHFAALTAGRLG